MESTKQNMAKNGWYLDTIEVQSKKPVQLLDKYGNPIEIKRQIGFSK